MSYVCKYDTSMPCDDENISSCDVCKKHPMYEQGRQDGAREFAEWISNTEYVANHNSFIWPIKGYFTIDDVMKQWIKEQAE